MIYDKAIPFVMSSVLPNTILTGIGLKTLITKRMLVLKTVKVEKTKKNNSMDCILIIQLFCFQGFLLLGFAKVLSSLEKVYVLLFLHSCFP